MLITNLIAGEGVENFTYRATNRDTWRNSLIIYQASLIILDMMEMATTGLD